MLTYNFPAVKGVQATSEYYICMIPLSLVDRIFLIDTDDVAPEFRAQRRLNEARIPEIKNYILSNRESYVFSALAASIDGTMQFNPSSKDSPIGILEVDMKSSFLINDGQHRKAAIHAALEEDESLADETIAVVIFRDKGLQRSQQMFTDLNKHAITTSKSLNTLYESKEPIAILTKDIIDNIEFFHRYTDKEKDNLGKFSSNIFTLNTFYEANKRILSSSSKVSNEYDFVLKFWSGVAENMKEWCEMDKGLLNKKDLRENYIATQGVTLLAFGRLGQFFLENRDIDMSKFLSGLSKIDWLRNNKQHWLGRAIKPNGKINRNEQGIFLTYLQIKRLLKLPITEEERNRENI